MASVAVAAAREAAAAVREAAVRAEEMEKGVPVAALVADVVVDDLEGASEVGEVVMVVQMVEQSIPAHGAGQTEAEVGEAAAAWATEVVALVEEMATVERQVEVVAPVGATVRAAADREVIMAAGGSREVGLAAAEAERVVDSPHTRSN